MSRARKQDRFSSTLAVSYREPTSNEPSLGTCVDISPSGMFIETPRPAARGVLVRFECVSQTTQGVVRGTARVMWLRPHNEALGKAGMGVRFVRLEPGSARVIEELIARATTAGGLARSDGPEARTMSDEPAVVLTAERTIGPTNRASSVPPKSLRAPTLRGLQAADVRSSAPPAPSRDEREREVQVAREPAEPRPAAASTPSSKAPGSSPPRSLAERRSSRPPLDKADKASAQELRERLDRARRPDETPAQAQRVERLPEDDDRTTEPDGSAIDPHRGREATAGKSLGATIHDATPLSVPTKLSANAGARRGSDHALGVPSPPPPPWKARHSERPPEPGGVEVVRTVQVVTDSQPAPGAPAEPPRPPSSAARPDPAPGAELPGADDPSPADWEPMSEPARPAMRPDRPPPDISIPYALPADVDDQPVESGRSWIPWFVVGSGLVVTLLMMLAFGMPTFSFGDKGDTKAAGSTDKPSDHLSAENVYTPRTGDSNEGAEVEPKQIIVRAHIEPLGARVSALGYTVTAPGSLYIPIDAARWPLRIRVEMQGFGGTEVALPRQLFATEGDSLVHELSLALQPILGAPPPAPVPAPAGPADVAKSKPAKSSPATKPRADKPASEPMAAAPPPAPAPPEPTEPKPAPTAAATPMQRALECLSRGDNACVLDALGSSTGSRELELLIETYRATGNTPSAEAAMRRYLELHPDGKRASQYRRALGALN